MRIYLKLATWPVVCSMLFITVTSTDLDLTGHLVSVVDNELLTMSCSKTIDDVPPLTAVRWYRNTKAIFQTVGGNVQPDDSNTSEYEEVLGRISVTTKQKEHKVMIKINSSLDDGSVWKCSVADFNSRNLTVVILNPTTGATLITTTPHHESISTDLQLPSGDPEVYVIAGSSAVVVINIVLVGFAVLRMKQTEVARDEEPEMVYGDDKEEASGNDKDVNNTEQASRMRDADAGMEPSNVDDDMYAKPVKKAERKVMMDCSLGNQG